MGRQSRYVCTLYCIEVETYYYRRQGKVDKAKMVWYSIDAIDDYIIT